MSGKNPVRPLRGQERVRLATQLAQRFVTERLSIHDLATEVGRRPSLVRRLLDEAGVTAEPPCLGFGPTELATRLSARYTDGAPIDQLCDETGLDRRVVRQLLFEAGTALPQRNRLTPDQSRWVIEQYRAGRSLRDLAEGVTCSYSTIRRTLLQANVEIRTSGTPPTPSPE